jgi:hypothetical protein
MMVSRLATEQTHDFHLPAVNAAATCCPACLLHTPSKQQPLVAQPHVPVQHGQQIDVSSEVHLEANGIQQVVM